MLLREFIQRVSPPAQGQASDSWRSLPFCLLRAGTGLSSPPKFSRAASLTPVPSSAPQGQSGLTRVSPGLLQMSWRPQYRSSKFRNVYGKVANREHCFDGIPITKNVHDNHFCAVNARFLAIVTESAGGGSFLVIPLEQVGPLHLLRPGCCPRAERSPAWSFLGLLPFVSLPPTFYFFIMCPVAAPSPKFSPRITGAGAAGGPEEHPGEDTFL